jgi:2'-5' RNA ligase
MLESESASLLASKMPDLEGVRRVPPGNLHVTLCFLGNIEADQRERLLLAAAQLDGCSTVARVDELTGYPSARRARTIVARLAEQPLLHRWHDRFLENWPDADHDRKFSAHVTLGRSRRGVRLPEVAGWSGLQVELLPPDVYVSQTLPTGAVYTRLSEQN